MGIFASMESSGRITTKESRRMDDDHAAFTDAMKKLMSDIQEQEKERKLQEKKEREEQGEKKDKLQANPSFWKLWFGTRSDWSFVKHDSFWKSRFGMPTIDYWDVNPQCDEPDSKEQEEASKKQQDHSTTEEEKNSDKPKKLRAYTVKIKSFRLLAGLAFMSSSKKDFQTRLALWTSMIMAAEEGNWVPVALQLMRRLGERRARVRRSRIRLDPVKAKRIYNEDFFVTDSEFDFWCKHGFSTNLMGTTKFPKLAWLFLGSNISALDDPSMLREFHLAERAKRQYVNCGSVQGLLLATELCNIGDILSIKTSDLILPFLRNYQYLCQVRINRKAIEEFLSFYVKERKKKDDERQRLGDADLRDRAHKFDDHARDLLSEYRLVATQFFPQANMHQRFLNELIAVRAAGDWEHDFHCAYIRSYGTAARNSLKEIEKSMDARLQNYQNTPFYAVLGTGLTLTGSLVFKANQAASVPPGPKSPYWGAKFLNKVKMSWRGAGPVGSAVVVGVATGLAYTGSQAICRLWWAKNAWNSTVCNPPEPGETKGSEATFYGYRFASSREKFFDDGKPSSKNLDLYELIPCPPSRK